MEQAVIAPAMSNVRTSSALGEGGAEMELGRVIAPAPVPFHQVVPLSAIVFKPSGNTRLPIFRLQGYQRRIRRGRLCCLHR